MCAAVCANRLSSVLPSCRTFPAFFSDGDTLTTYPSRSGTVNHSASVSSSMRHTPAVLTAGSVHDCSLGNSRYLGQLIFVPPISGWRDRHPTIRDQEFPRCVSRFSSLRVPSHTTWDPRSHRSEER